MDDKLYTPCIKNARELKFQGHVGRHDFFHVQASQGRSSQSLLLQGVSVWSVAPVAGVTGVVVHVV